MRFSCQPKAPWFWGFGFWGYGFWAKGLGPGLDTKSSENVSLRSGEFPYESCVCPPLNTIIFFDFNLYKHVDFLTCPYFRTEKQRRSLTKLL